MRIKVRCSNPACGQTSLLVDDGLRRVFRCRGCWSKLGTPRVPARSEAGCAVAPDGDSCARGLRITTDAAQEPAPCLGRLQLRHKLGSGSFATIYHAFDPLLERDVTLKVFDRRDEECAKDVAHFVSEAKALARLRHPQIVPIYDAGRDGRYHYITMAYINGRTLADALADGPLDFRAAARVVSDVAEALAYAHGLGIVHRDVKPSNIVLDDRGTAHLIDFGLAHRPDLACELGPTGLIRGTPAYLAPEQARGDDAPPEPANDQYSLGAVLYELLCGRPPFVGPPLLVLVSALKYEPALPRTLDPNVPHELEAICLRTLAKRPEDRYPSCESLAEDLQRWLRGEPTVTARGQAPVRRTPAWCQPLRALAASLLSALFSMLVILTMSRRGGSS